MSEYNSREYRQRLKRYERKKALVAYSFIAPNFIGFAIFTLVPVLFSIFLSFVRWKGGSLSTMEWVGLGNYAEIFKPRRWPKRASATCSPRWTWASP